VLDRGLPSISGDEVCRQLIASTPPDPVPRIMVLPRRVATSWGRSLRLTREEFGVLEVLAAANGGVVSAEELLERVWDEAANPFTNAVRFTVVTLLYGGHFCAAGFVLTALTYGLVNRALEEREPPRGGP
jgi:DNA-binding response OmpR family regulator